MKQGTLFEAANTPPTEEPICTKDARRQGGRNTPPESVGGFSLNRIYLTDCIAAMASLPDASFDVAIADPPYNLSKGGNWKWDNSIDLPGFGGNWNKVMASWDDMTLADYMGFTLAWLKELKRVVRPSGSLWIHGTYHNIGLINFALQLLGVEIVNEVVWFKRNSFPNLAGRRLTASHETILWAHTGGKKRQYFFDYAKSKQMHFPEDLLKEEGKQMRTVWDIPNNKAREELVHGKHPTQKPVRLLRRMLELSAKPGGRCLIPFGGAGSECVACSDLSMDFLGFEIEPEYYEIARQRLAAVGCSFPSEVPAGKPPAEEDENGDGTLSSSVPSLVKWTGSKRSQADSIRGEMPAFGRYFEPFLGSGAVLFTVAGMPAVGGDVYKPLIDLWKIVQSDPEAVIGNYRSQWLALQKELPEYYYTVRERFNSEPNPFDLNFLLRTCVNGIVRFNDKGEFNNSFHLSRPGMHPDRYQSVVLSWHHAVRNTEFMCADFEETLATSKPGDFVYLDPPYQGNKQRYIANLDIDRLWKILESLNRREIRWALSFDGKRGTKDLRSDVPEDLFKRHIFLRSGNSPVGKVLNGPVEMVHESLYLNY
jgi:site-specific DNA-methyltransferase (adenine-specific)